MRSRSLPTASVRRLSLMMAICLVTCRRSIQVPSNPSNATALVTASATNNRCVFHHGAGVIKCTALESARCKRKPSTQLIRGKAWVVVNSQIPVSEIMSPGVKSGGGDFSLGNRTSKICCPARH